MRRVALIVNPFATNVSERKLRAVEEVLAPVQTLLTERRGHATELARSVDAEAIVVLGGDGVANEVLNGVQSDVTLGFLPGGGTSVLPRALGLPRDVVEAARRLSEGRTRRITVGRVNGRRFAFAAGVGLDAATVRRVDALGRSNDGKRPGDLAFTYEFLRELASARFRLEPSLEIDGLGRAAAVVVANCDPYTYAGPLPLHFAPDARFELGLDVVAPVRVTTRSLPRLLRYVVRGAGQQRASDILYAHDVDRVVVRCDRPLPLQVDGEDLGDVEHATFEAEREALVVLA